MNTQRIKRKNAEKSLNSKKYKKPSPRSCLRLTGGIEKAWQPTSYSKSKKQRTFDSISEWQLLQQDKLRERCQDPLIFEEIPTNEEPATNFYPTENWMGIYEEK